MDSIEFPNLMGKNAHFFFFLSSEKRGQEPFENWGLQLGLF